MTPARFGVDDLEDEQLKWLSLRLLAHVRQRARRLFGWLGTGTADLGLGKHCEDIVLSVIEVMLERAEWEPLPLAEILERLRSAANSELVNLLKKLQRRAQKGEALAHDGEFLDVVSYLPETAEDRVAFREFMGALETAILEKDDEDLTKLFDLALADGDLSPTRVSEKLGLSVREVDNLKRKLRALVNNVRVQLGEAPVKTARGAVQ